MQVSNGRMHADGQPVTNMPHQLLRSWKLALPTSDRGVAGSNPAGGEILPKSKRRFIAQSLSCSPFHRLKMTNTVEGT